MEKWKPDYCLVGQVKGFEFNSKYDWKPLVYSQWRIDITWFMFLKDHWGCWLNDRGTITKAKTTLDWYYICPVKMAWLWLINNEDREKWSDWEYTLPAETKGPGDMI